MQGIGENIYLSSINSYDKPISKRISYYLKHLSVKHRFTELINSGPADIVQIRIPSLFSMAAYPVVKKAGLPLTTYISGDWRTSFTGNYKFPGNHLVGKGLDRLQQSIIKNSAPVTAGPILSQQYSNLNDCHAYFSTSHNDIIPKEINSPPKNIIFVGRLEPLKRLCDAIEAVGLLKKQNVDVCFNIVGEGVMRDKLEKQVEIAGLEDRVIFKGQINNTETLRELYIAADILVLPSLSEGTPKVVAEAMAHGTVPIAVSGTGSNDYIIEHDCNGFLTAPKSPEEIVKYIQKLRSSPKLHQKMVEQGYAYARQHTLDKEVDKLWDFVFSHTKGKINV
jgi:glycosyltransferase involved in cell wall biosynthesis